MILDYGHNLAALEALGAAVMALPPKQTVMSLTLPSDRRDEAIIASTTATISYIDAYVVYDSEDRRGRAVNEVAELVCRHIPADLPCEIVIGQRAGILRAWQLVKLGDRLLVICDSVPEALTILNDLAQCLQQDGACTSPVLTDVKVAGQHLIVPSTFAGNSQLACYSARIPSPLHRGFLQNDRREPYVWRNLTVSGK